MFYLLFHCSLSTGVSIWFVNLEEQACVTSLPILLFCTGMLWILAINSVDSSSVTLPWICIFVLTVPQFFSEHLFIPLSDMYCTTSTHNYFEWGVISDMLRLAELIHSQFFSCSLIYFPFFCFGGCYPSIASLHLSIVITEYSSYN